MPVLTPTPNSSFQRWAVQAVSCGCLLMLAFSVSASRIQADDLIASNAVVDKAGLTIDWFTQSGVAGKESIVDSVLNVNENKATTFFVLEAGKIREVISEKSLDAFGKPFGIEGALQYIEDRKEVISAELKNEGITNVEIKLDQYTLPESTVYTLSSDGVVTAINADTGKTNWTAEIGDNRVPSIGLAVSDDFVAAANVLSVYLLEASTGRVLWTRKCAGPIAAPPAVSDERIYVPLTNGRMESFPTGNGGGGSFTFVARGRGTVRPLITDLTVSWPTSTGDLNIAVLHGDKTNAISYRLVSDEAIVSSPAYKDGTLYVSSLDGFVYAIDEQTGSIKWEVSTGEGISQSPVPLGTSVYVVTDDRKFYKLDAKTGYQQWAKPIENMGQFVGASQARIYLTDPFGRLVVIGRESGAILSQIPAGQIDHIATNSQTDRLYFGSHAGLLQCLREKQSHTPYFHANELESKAEPSAVSLDGSAEKKPPEPKMEDDPFGGLGKPDNQPAPKTDSKPATAEDDPFKTGGGQ